jgi:hypothetical protein
VEAAKDEARRHGKKAVTENRHPRDGTDLYDVLSPMLARNQNHPSVATALTAR